MVDEQDQGRVARARLTFRPRSAAGVLEDAYEGVRLERRVRFEPPLIRVEDRCASDAPRRFTWVFHARGGMALRAALRAARPRDPLGLPPLPEDGPFAWFTNRWTTAAEGVVCADWRVSERVCLRLLLTSDGPFEVTAGHTPGNPIPDGRSTILLRAAGQERTFRAAFEVHRGAPSLTPDDLTIQKGDRS